MRAAPRLSLQGRRLTWPPRARLGATTPTAQHWGGISGLHFPSSVVSYAVEREWLPLRPAADCRVIVPYAGLSGSRAVLSPNCAPQKQKNWRSSCASECGSGTLQCRCMLRPQPGQRGGAVGRPDSVLLGIVLMSTSWRPSAREMPITLGTLLREGACQKMPPLRTAVEPRPAGREGAWPGCGIEPRMPRPPANVISITFAATGGASPA